MAARLKWDGNDLMLGPFVLATACYMEGIKEWVVRMPLTVSNVWHKSLSNAKQVAESKVRRLLKEAGVEVEP